MITGFLYDPRYLNHDTGQGHPERRQRLEAAIAHLQDQPWFADLKRFVPRPVERKWIETTHSSDYIDRVKTAIETGQTMIDTPDVQVSRDSYEVALLAAGGLLEMADQVVLRHVDNGFAMVRPPGHHAEQSIAMGFCLFNNIAIAARYLQQHHGINKVLILDWDVHHGNGTQHSFEEDPSVMYISLHQYPYYPGTGAYSETGVGRGSGSVVNCPMAAGSGDSHYETAFMDTVLPAIDDFEPDFILLSAGFDAHMDDPLADIRLSTGFFHWMSERMMEMADKHCGGRLLSVLEGGYSLSALPPSIAQHLQSLMQSQDQG